MSLLRRPELWVLAAIAALAAYFALRPGGAEPAGDAPEGPAAGTPSRLAVTRLTLTRDYGNARLDIAFTYDNRGGAPVTMAPPDVVFRAGENEVVPFFLVGSFSDPLPADRKVTGTAKYWLEPEHFALPMTFSVRGEEAEVKGAGAFDLGSLENGEPASVTPGEW